MAAEGVGPEEPGGECSVTSAQGTPGLPEKTAGCAAWAPGQRVGCHVASLYVPLGEGPGMLRPHTHCVISQWASTSQPPTCLPRMQTLRLHSGQRPQELWAEGPRNLHHYAGLSKALLCPEVLLPLRKVSLGPFYRWRHKSSERLPDLMSYSY